MEEHLIRKAAMAKIMLQNKVIFKIWYEIYPAAKVDPDIESNATLKDGRRAKKAQVPADIIKRAIDKAKWCC